MSIQPRIGRKPKLLVGTLVVLATTIHPGPAIAGIGEWCEGTWLGDDVHLPGDWNWDHMDGNDIYLRWAAAQYIGHETDHWVNGIHQLAWVGARDPVTGLRSLNLARVMDFDPECLPLRDSELTTSTVNDVNWVSQGGFIPQGHANGAW